MKYLDFCTGLPEKWGNLYGGRMYSAQKSLNITASDN